MNEGCDCDEVDEELDNVELDELVKLFDATELVEGRKAEEEELTGVTSVDVGDTLGDEELGAPELDGGVDEDLKVDELIRDD